MVGQPEADANDPFVAYFHSDLHARRNEEAMKREIERLSAIGRTDLLALLSEAYGVLFAVGHVLKTLGLKHQAAQMFWGVGKWLKTGT